MRNAALLLACIFLCSCSSPKVRMEQGYGEALAIGKLLNDHGSGEPLDLHLTRLSIGAEVLRIRDLSFEAFAGAWSAAPQEHESSVGAGLSVLPRMTYLGFGDVRPYLGYNLGLGYADWRQQGSDFGFAVGPSIGVLYPWSKRIDLTLSWDLFHWSNAQISRPNPGLNADVFLIGFEYKF